MVYDVYVFVRGGMVQGVLASEKVNIEVLDFDTQDEDEIREIETLYDDLQKQRSEGKLVAVY